MGMAQLTTAMPYFFSMATFRKIENLKEWQALLEKALFKTFFHTLEWESFLEQNFKWLKFERYIWSG